MRRPAAPGLAGIRAAKRTLTRRHLHVRTRRQDRSGHYGTNPGFATSVFAAGALIHDAGPAGPFPASRAFGDFRLPLQDARATADARPRPDTAMASLLILQVSSYRRNLLT